MEKWRHGDIETMTGSSSFVNSYFIGRQPYNLVDIDIIYFWLTEMSHLGRSNDTFTS